MISSKLSEIEILMNNKELVLIIGSFGKIKSILKHELKNKKIIFVDLKT